MAYTAWQASNSYAVGDVVRPATTTGTGLVFRCTTAGTSAATEPDPWPVVRGTEVEDGTCVWEAVSAVGEELNKLAPSAVIELFELDGTASNIGVDQVYRFHAGVNEQISGNIVWNGNTYVRFPVKAEGFEYTNTGTLPRPTLTVANLSGSISVLLLEINLTTSGNDLAGAEVRRIRTLKKYLDGETAADPHAKFPDEVWYCDRKASENRELVTFELASKFDLAGVMLPKRQIIANICQWEYRSAECSYTGSNYFDVDDNSVASLSNDKCGKRLSSCKKRFGENGQLPFGSFPGAGLSQ